MFKFLRKSTLLKAEEFFESFQRLIYPPLCLHCREELALKKYFLCENCFSSLELIDPLERCSYCFSPSGQSTSCRHCEQNPPALYRIAAAFDYMGPAATLIKEMKYFNQSYLSEGLAAYMVLQFLTLKWPKPDVIVPVPISFSHWIQRGYNQSFLLAKEVGRLLECPVKEVLGRYSGDYSQAGLNHEQRKSLEGNSLFLRNKQVLHDQNVLLIDDVLTTGTTFRKCAEALEQGCPSKVYGLTVCCG